MDHNNLPFWCLPGAGGQADGSARLPPHLTPPPPASLQSEMDYYSELLSSLSPVGGGGQVFTQVAPCTTAEAARVLDDGGCAGGDDDDNDKYEDISDSLSDGGDKEGPSTAVNCGGSSQLPKGVDGRNEPGKRKKRNRTSEMHSLSERRRRDRIKAKLKTLQELLPNSHKLDRASMLDEVIAYVKWLQQQLQLMTRSGLFPAPTFSSPAATFRGLCMPQISPYSTMRPNFCMNMGHGVPAPGTSCSMGTSPLPGFSSFPGTVLFPMANWSPVQQFHSPVNSNLQYGASPSSQQFPWTSAAEAAVAVAPVCNEDLQAELLHPVDQVLTSCSEMNDPIVGDDPFVRKMTQKSNISRSCSTTSS